MTTDLDHNAECTGWHTVEGGERRCLACNPDGEGAYGPPPWHTGPWTVDGVVKKPVVTGVTVTRAEGLVALCVTKTYATIDEATVALYAAKSTYPTLGYDKHDVKITWDDGETYEARLDCQNSENGDCNIRVHAVEFLECYAGLRCPPHMEPPRYAAFLRESYRANGTTAADYAALLPRFA